MIILKSPEFVIKQIQGTFFIMIFLTIFIMDSFSGTILYNNY